MQRSPPRFPRQCHAPPQGAQSRLVCCRVNGVTLCAFLGDPPPLHALPVPSVLPSASGAWVQFHWEGGSCWLRNLRPAYATALAGPWVPPTEGWSEQRAWDTLACVPLRPSPGSGCSYLQPDRTLSACKCLQQPSLPRARSTHRRVRSSPTLNGARLLMIRCESKAVESLSCL